jgi:hypothetical protein
MAKEKFEEIMVENSPNLMDTQESQQTPSRISSLRIPH